MATWRSASFSLFFFCFQTEILCTSNTFRDEVSDLIYLGKSESSVSRSQQRVITYELSATTFQFCFDVCNTARANHSYGPLTICVDL
ncbi:hypothetical protein AAC387_Pa12g0406 [Persea americana]